MAISYPAGLPLAMRDGYAFSPVNQITRTEMQSGRARQRVEFTNTPSMLKVKWIFNELEARLFEAWYRQVARAGWFTMTILSPLGFEDVEVRFTETPDGGALTGKFLWQYSATLEVREPPTLEPGWAEILPDYILMADIFDYAVNREWPDSPYQTYMDTFDYAVNEEWPAA